MQGKGSIVQRKNNSLMREQYLMRIEEKFSEAINTAKVIDMAQEELVSIFEKMLEENQ